MSYDTRAFSTSIIEIHQRVPYDHWCVTRKDLRELRRDICRALDAGAILPTSRDNFDPHDRDIGPNMYTIVEQYIKPLTALFGNSSWALMKHPKGMKCDLFITHSWKEGIFEFLAKVLCSWPYSTKHAYMCVLSNPQNLHIDAMLSCPSDSPFARALASCSHILVVPNAKASVYSRLWCVYEAFLGYRLGKVIRTARRPLIKRYTLALMELIPTFMLGLILVHLFTQYCPGQPRSLFMLIYWWLLAVCAVLEDPPLVKRISIHFLVVYTVYALVQRGPECARVLNCSQTFIALYCYGSYAEIFFNLALAMIDLVINDEVAAEAQELLKDFSGDIRDAQCSVVADRETIFAEIGDRFEEVNHTILVLLEAGMSTPEFQALHRRGVAVRNAGHINLSLTFLGAFHWLNQGILWHRIVGIRERLSMRQVFMLSSFVCWVILWLCSAKDRRAFASAAAGRFFFVAWVFVWTAVELVIGTHLHFENRTALVDCDFCLRVRGLYCTFFSGIAVATFVISALGPVRTTRIPFTGKCLTQYLLSQSIFKFRRAGSNCHGSVGIEQTGFSRETELVHMASACKKAPQDVLRMPR